MKPQRFMTQAIQTKYLGPTNTHGSRIKAWCQARAIIRPVDHSLSMENRHHDVAMELADMLDWPGPWYGGALPDPSTGYAFVQLNLTFD